MMFKFIRELFVDEHALDRDMYIQSEVVRLGRLEEEPGKTYVDLDALKPYSIEWNHLANNYTGGTEYACYKMDGETRRYFVKSNLADHLNAVAEFKHWVAENKG